MEISVNFHDSLSIWKTLRQPATLLEYFFVLQNLKFSLFPTSFFTKNQRFFHEISQKYKQKQIVCLEISYRVVFCKFNFLNLHLKQTQKILKIFLLSSVIYKKTKTFPSKIPKNDDAMNKVFDVCTFFYKASSALTRNWMTEDVKRVRGWGKKKMTVGLAVKSKHST